MPDRASSRPEARQSPFRNRDFALLWSGGLVSDLGDWMLLVALPVFVFQLTGSALTTSTVFVAELVPGLVVGQLAGVFVDRWDKRQILVVAGIIQAAALLPLIAVTVDRLWIVYLVAAVEASLARLCGPAKAALIPALVREDQLAESNAANAVSDNIARLVGSPLGGLAIQVIGLPGIVLIDAASYLLSAVLAVGIRKRSVPSATGSSGRTNVVGEWIDGLRTIRRTPPLMAVLAIGALSQIAQGIFVVLFVVFVLQQLHGGGAEVGLIRGMQAIGGIAGGLAIGALSRRFSPRHLTGWGFIVFGLISLITWNAPGWSTATPLYVGLFVIVGLPGVATWTGLLTIIQSTAPATHLGRVFATFETGAGLLQTVGVLFAGALADRIGAVTVLDGQASIYLICGVLALFALRASERPRGSELPPNRVQALDAPEYR